MFLSLQVLYVLDSQVTGTWELVTYSAVQEVDSAEKLMTEKGEVHEKEAEVETCSKVKEELGKKLADVAMLQEKCR